jgi:hypothetical protein
MEMHFGVLTSELTSAQLFAILEKLAPTFVPSNPVQSIADVSLSDLAADEGWGLIAGDVDGRGVIIDSSYLLSGSEPDLIAYLARETGKLPPHRRRLDGVRATDPRRSATIC